jgi:ribose transport system substrate-binding protein
MSGLRRSFAAALAIGLALTACGDDDNASSGTQDEQGDVGADTTTGDAAPSSDVITTPPQEMTVTEPLPSAPEPHTVAFVNCAVPACQVNEPFLEDALDALGWELTVITYDAAAPGSAFQQAIDAGVDYIATSGLPLAAIEEQVTEASAAGIPIFEVYSTDEPGGEANNLYSQIGGSASVFNASDVLADWVIADSDGSANVVFVTIRDFPILVDEEEATAEAFAACDGCSFEALPVTIADLGAGTVPQQIASHLQSNPDADYVWFSFSNLSTGVSDALDGAGLLEGRKLVGMQHETPQLSEIVDGTNAAWTAVPYQYGMWLLADQMARHATGVWDQALEAEVSVVPTWVVDSPEVAESLVPTDGWPGPEGFEDSFRALWGVSS